MPDAGPKIVPSHDRAIEVRAMEARVADPEIKRILVDIAQRYDAAKLTAERGEVSKRPKAVAQLVAENATSISRLGGGYMTAQPRCARGAPLRDFGSRSWSPPRYRSQTGH